MVVELVGAESLAACEAELATGEWRSCAVRIADCLVLVIWAPPAGEARGPDPGFAMLSVEGCRPSDDGWLLYGGPERTRAVPITPPGE